MEIKYHFLNANTSYYENNSFNELLKKEEKYKGVIYWCIGNHKINAGDICYIYFSNLPDDSSRILFMGKVIDSDLNHTELKSIYPGASKNKKYVKLKIKSISLENNEIFNFDNLRNKYNLISSSNFNYLHVDKIKHKKLIDDINNASNNNHNLKYVLKYFDKNYCICEFGCKTFVEENGFHYIERHHLVEKRIIKKYNNIENIDKIINNRNNSFKLCPMCYKKIHYAEKEDRMNMIKFLYNKNKNYFDTEYNVCKQNKNTLNWLYEIYKCN